MSQQTELQTLFPIFPLLSLARKGSVPELIGIISCDSAAIRIWIRIARCEWPAKRPKHKPCETKAPFSPILPVGSQESVLKVPK